jgi:hypothetical protein
MRVTAASRKGLEPMKASRMQSYAFGSNLLLAVGILVLGFGQVLGAPTTDPADADTEAAIASPSYQSRFDDGCWHDWKGAIGCQGDAIGNHIHTGGQRTISPLSTTMSVSEAQPANGCAGERAGAPHIVCPLSEPASQYIEYVRSTEEGVSIFLTPDGIDLGLTCRGAEQLVELASDLYSQIPSWERTHGDLLWANPNITREVFGHAVAADRGIPNGNPVDIVFEDYSAGSTSLQGAIWRGVLVDWVQILSCRPEDNSE